MKSFFMVIVIINIQLVIPSRTIDSNKRLVLTSTNSSFGKSENENMELKKNGLRNKRHSPNERNRDIRHAKDIKERSQREMIYYDDDEAPSLKNNKYFYLGLTFLVIKKFLFLFFTIFILPVILLKLFTIVAIPLKFLIGIKALGIANTIILGMILLRLSLVPPISFNPSLPGIQTPIFPGISGTPLQNDVKIEEDGNKTELQAAYQQPNIPDSIIKDDETDSEEDYELL